MEVDVQETGDMVDGTSILIAFVSPKKVEQKIYLSGCGLKPVAGGRAADI